MNKELAMETHYTGFRSDLPVGRSPNSLKFVVEDQIVELKRMEGQYIAMGISSKHAVSAKGVFTAFEEGEVTAHTAVDLYLYLSFGYGFDVESATLEDFRSNFRYFYTIVSDPTRAIDRTGGCMVLYDVPQRVKSGSGSYWMPGTDYAGSDREMQPDAILIRFDQWEDGVLSGRCMDSASSDGDHWKGGTCDVAVSFRVRLTEPDWYRRALQAKRDATRPGYQRLSEALRECASKGAPRNRRTVEEIVESLRTIFEEFPSEAGYWDAYGNFPLHRACSMGCPLPIVQLLYGAYPKAIELQGDCGFLPLHHACNYNKLINCWDVVRFLVETYPDGRLKREECGRLPIYYLCENKRTGEIPLEETEKCFDDFLRGCEDTLVAKNGRQENGGGCTVLQMCRNNDFRNILSRRILHIQSECNALERDWQKTFPREAIRHILDYAGGLFTVQIPRSWRAAADDSDDDDDDDL